MQKAASIIVALAASGLAIAVLYRTPAVVPVGAATIRPLASTPAADAGESPDGAPTTASSAVPDAPKSDDAGIGGEGGAGAAEALALPPVNYGAVRMPDGSPVPPLPNDAPRSVRLGVALVTHNEAQPSIAGTPNSKRTRAEAKELASKLAEEAKKSFREAVAKADQGSGEDLGRFQRGLVDPYVEYMIFTLPVGKTSEPIDSPRGFWIVKRHE